MLVYPATSELNTQPVQNPLIISPRHTASCNNFSLFNFFFLFFLLANSYSRLFFVRNALLILLYMFLPHVSRSRKFSLVSRFHFNSLFYIFSFFFFFLGFRLRVCFGDGERDRPLRLSSFSFFFSPPFPYYFSLVFFSLVALVAAPGMLYVRVCASL